MFGSLLEEVMKKYKIKGKNLSIASNLTEGFISDIKKEKTLPSFKNLKIIIDCLVIQENEKEKLIEAWEKESSPIEFVKKYEEIILKYDIMTKFLNEGNEVIEKKIEKLIRLNEELKKEIEDLIVYKEFFFLVHDDDLKYILNKLSIENENESLEKLNVILRKKLGKK